MPTLRLPTGAQLLAACTVLAAFACSPDPDPLTPGMETSPDSTSEGSDDATTTTPETDTEGGENTSTETTDSESGAPEPDLGGPIDQDGPWQGSLLAEVECTLTGDACTAIEVDAGVQASYRKDHFLPEELYAEGSLEWDPPLPVNGGRFHITGRAASAGAVTQVEIGGVPVESLLDPQNGTPTLEWYHVWPDPVISGDPLWVTFHSRDPAWDGRESGELRVTTEQGVALEGSFPVRETTAPITYVSYDEGLGELYVHVRNDGLMPVTLTRLIVDGRDVLATDVACVADPTLAPGQVAMWTVPRCTPAELGEAWTVVADWEGSEDAVAVGRYLRPHFPIHTWPRTSDCAKPGGNQPFLDRHYEAGFDTFYIYWFDDCSSYSTQEVVNTHAPALGGDYQLLLGDDLNNVVLGGEAGGLITDTSAVAGMLTGDESDGEIYEQDGKPHPESKAEVARWMWRNYPDITMYNGAKTNKNIGTFAGMVDVQGIDVYVAACAPWITGLEPPPLRASYDYLLNARNNHMPWPTWQYSQGLAEWKGEPPTRPEILVQAFSVMAAGGKGLMWFQTIEPIANAFPESWDAMAQANWVFRGLREQLQRGDITGKATTDGDTITELIRSDDALIVPIISLANDGGPDLLSCTLADLIDDVPHWDLTPQIVELTVEIPDDFEILDVFELLVDDSGPQVIDLAYPGFVTGREVSFAGILLNEAIPTRVLVFASDPQLRAEVSAALAH